MATNSEGTGALHSAETHRPASAGLRPQPRPPAAGPAPADAAQAEESRRMMREAAWARMFGKSGSANPFSRP